MAAAPARAPRAPRRAPPRRRPARRRTPTSGFAAVPAAVGMTAHAVGGLADSGVVFRLTRGRAWIPLLAMLLTGLVAANLYALSLNASAARTAATTDELARENSILQSKASRLLAGGRAESVGASGGMVVPAPDSISFLRSSGADGARAADRLGGELTAGGLAPAVDPAIVPDPAATADPDALADPAISPPAPAAGVTPEGG